MLFVCYRRRMALEQLPVLLERSARNTYRNKFLTTYRLLQDLFVGVIIGLAFLRLDNDQVGVQVMWVCIWCVCIYMCVCVCVCLCVRVCVLLVFGWIVTAYLIHWWYVILFTDDMFFFSILFFRISAEWFSSFWCRKCGARLILLSMFVCLILIPAYIRGQKWAVTFS